MIPGRDRISELVIVLERLTGYYHQLTALAREKLTAMGRNDLDALRVITESEEALIRSVQEQDGLRRQILELVGRAFGIAPQLARRMTASQWLQRLEPNRRAEFESAVKLMRTAGAELSEANRVAGLVAAQVLTHLREVFTAISGASDRSEVYAPSGRMPTPGARVIFEATV